MCYDSGDQGIGQLAGPSIGQLVNESVSRQLPGYQLTNYQLPDYQLPS
jgi:hypothetical protein